MKKIVYLAPLALIGIGTKASASQAPTHISNALSVYEQENQNAHIDQATHISRLDKGLIDDDSLVGKGQEQVSVNGQALKLSNRRGQDKADSQASMSSIQTMSSEPNQPTYQVNEEKVVVGKQFIVKNPANDKLIVHFVNADGSNIQGLSEQTIDTSKEGKVQYQVPNNYKLKYVNDNQVIHKSYFASKELGNYYPGKLSEFDAFKTNLWIVAVKQNMERLQKEYNFQLGDHIWIDHQESSQGVFDYDHLSIDDKNGNTKYYFAINGHDFTDANLVKLTPQWIKDMFHRVVNDDNDTDQRDVHVGCSWGHYVTDHDFIDNTGNAISTHANVINVALVHQTKSIDNDSAILNSNATLHSYAINGDAAKASSSVKFHTTGLLDLVTNVIVPTDNWHVVGNSNFTSNFGSNLTGFTSLNSNLSALTL